MKRRTFVGAAAAGLPAFSILGAGSARAQVKEIRMIEAGGKSGESVEVGYIEPFTKKTGIKVIRESPNPLGKLRALVESGQTSTVLMELGSGGMLQARNLKLIEPIDWAAVAPQPMFPEAKHEYGFGYQYFSTIMAWRAGAKAPKTWADFFNTKDFRASAVCRIIPTTRSPSRCSPPGSRRTSSSRSTSTRPSRS